ncbi:MAG TPA: WD40 repeat domain-containing protein [Myxococcota bacterium]|nr:WD40 repeat domain-containing protein [Myxococcota bacterium]
MSRTFPDMIFASAFEPDNRHLVAIDYVGNGHRLDLATGEERQFEAFEGRDPYLLSQDGRWLAIARPNGEIVLRDLTTQTTRVLGSHGGPSYGASFSEDLALLATGGMDGRVLVWDVRTGKLLHTLAGHRGQAWPFTFSKSNRWFITGGADHTIRLWDLSSGSLVREIDDWFGTIFPERDLLDTYSPTEGMARKNRVRVWDLAENKLLEEREFPMSQILSGNLARDARYWIRSHQDGQIDYLEYPGWNRFSFPAGAVIQGLFLTRRSDLLVGTDLAGNLRAWRFPSGLPIGVFGHHANLVTGWWGSMDDRFLASASTDKDLSVWDLAALRPERVRTGHAGKVIRLVMSPDGKQLASGGFDKTVRLWDLTTGRSTMVLSGHAAVIQWGLAFSPDSRVVASGSFDKTVRLWDATTGQQLKVLEGHVAGVDSVAFSPDGQLLATATQGLERPLILWDVASGKPIHVLEHRVPGVGTVAFSPDGRTLAAGTSGKKPLLFDVKTFTELPIRGEGVYGVRSGTFSPDGGKLAAGLDVGTIELWDLREGTVRELGRHERGAFGISFHPDGKRLGSASADGTARIWDLETGEYEVIARHRGYDVNSIVFSPDGRLAATSGDDETVRLWDVETRRPVWRAPVLLPRQGEPPEVFTHEGWQAVVEPPQPLAPPPSAWRKAAEQARFGSAANADGVLCLQTFENGLELWDRRGDKMIWREQQKDLGQVLALPRACAWIAGGKAHLVDGQGAPRSLCDQATALGRDGEVLLVACADRVRSFDAAGMELVAQARSIQAGATALARNEYWLLVGQPSGELEALSLASGASALARTFDQPRPSPIRHLVPGPMDTVIVGQDDGSVSLWDLRSGVLLDRFFLHGWVEHLLLDDHKLHAVSDLGDRLVWDLDVLTLGRCELLQAVWKKAPGVWDVGRAVVRAPAPVDGCVPAGNQPAP